MTTGSLTRPNAVVFVTWTQDKSQLTGELEQGLLQTDTGSGQDSVANEDVSFTGAISGSSVTLTLNQGLAATRNLTGTLTGNELDLNYPGQGSSVITLQMQAGTANDYNQDLNALQGQAGQANSQVQQAQAAQRQSQLVANDAQNVATALSSLESGTKSLGSTDYYSAGLAAEQNDVSQTHTDMQTVLNEAGNTDSGSLCSDAGTVQSDVGTVQSDVGTIQSDQGASNSDINAVTGELSQLQKAGQALQSDRTDNAADVPPDAPTEADVQGALRAAQAAIAKAKTAGQAALGQANQMEATAAGYQSKSDAACKAAGGS